MDAQQTGIIGKFLVADFEREIPTTLGVIEAAQGGNLDYRPDPKAKSGLGLVRHLALEDEWMLNCIADGQFVPPPDDSDDCGIMNAEEAAARYRERVPPALERVRALSNDQLAASIDLMGMMQLPAAAVLAMAAKHAVHHRGQLSSYLRAMGGKVPSIYGPSADTQ